MSGTDEALRFNRRSMSRWRTTNAKSRDFWAMGCNRSDFPDPRIGVDSQREWIHRLRSIVPSGPEINAKPSTGISKRNDAAPSVASSPTSQLSKQLTTGELRGHGQSDARRMVHARLYCFAWFDFQSSQSPCLATRSPCWCASSRSFAEGFHRRMRTRSKFSQISMLLDHE